MKGRHGKELMDSQGCSLNVDLMLGRLFGWDRFGNSSSWPFHILSIVLLPVDKAYGYQFLSEMHAICSFDPASSLDAR